MKHHISQQLLSPTRVVGYLFSGLVFFSLFICGCQRSHLEENNTIELLNVSYDPTREFYQEINPLFAEFWKKKTGESVQISMSHGGSGKQARSVINGLEADVVSLALEYDINAISKTGLIESDWRSRFPFHSAPYTSTVVFLVRKNNPKNIADWDDLIRPDVSVITPNPKTSGGARWNYLAAWAYAQKRWNSDQKARSFLTGLYTNVPVLDSGARGSTTTFVERGIGDVLLTWENEALLAINELGPESLDIVYPSISILAEPSIAMVTSNCIKHQTQDCARGYLQFLYSDAAQSIITKHHFRSHSQKPSLQIFPSVIRLTIDEVAGGWDAAQKRHFNDGGEFDQLYNEMNRKKHDS